MQAYLPSLVFVAILCRVWTRLNIVDRLESVRQNVPSPADPKVAGKGLPFLFLRVFFSPSFHLLPTPHHVTRPDDRIPP